MKWSSPVSVQIVRNRKLAHNEVRQWRVYGIQAFVPGGALERQLEVVAEILPCGNNGAPFSAFLHILTRQTSSEGGHRSCDKKQQERRNNQKQKQTRSRNSSAESLLMNNAHVDCSSLRP